MQCGGFDYQGLKGPAPIAKSDAIPKLASMLKNFFLRIFRGYLSDPQLFAYFISIYIYDNFVITYIFHWCFYGPNKKLLIYLVNNFHPIKKVIMNAFN